MYSKYKNVHSYYTTNLENCIIKQHRLNVFLNLPHEIASKLVKKLPKEITILDNTRSVIQMLNN